MSTANDLLNNYQHIVTELRLVPGSKGIFDVVVNGDMIFRKDDVDRHANPGEVLALFSDLVGPDVPRFHDQ